MPPASARSQQRLTGLSRLTASSRCECGPHARTQPAVRACAEISGGQQCAGATWTCRPIHCCPAVGDAAPAAHPVWLKPDSQSNSSSSSGMLPASSARSFACCACCAFFSSFESRRLACPQKPVSHNHHQFRPRTSLQLTPLVHDTKTKMYRTCTGLPFSSSSCNTHVGFLSWPKDYTMWSMRMNNSPTCTGSPQTLIGWCWCCRWTHRKLPTTRGVTVGQHTVSRAYLEQCIWSELLRSWPQHFPPDVSSSLQSCTNQ